MKKEKKIGSQPVVIGSDHGGFKLKEAIVSLLKSKHIPVTDVGCFDENSVDYPLIASDVAGRVGSGRAARGILICGTGIGMAMAANKVKGVRAAVCYDQYTARMSREHNNANLLALGGRTTPLAKAKKIVEIWLVTPFEGGRHERRVRQIMAQDKKR